MKLSKKGLTQEMALEKLDEDEYIRIKVIQHLKQHPLTAFTISGIMIQSFKISESKKNWCGGRDSNTRIQENKPNFFTKYFNKQKKNCTI